MSAENYVYKKEVDWSLFNYGLSIPISHQVIFRQIAGRFIERGESKEITLYLNGRSYKARLNNLRIDPKYKNHVDMVHIRYSAGSDIAEALRGCFSRSYAYISRLKELQPPGSKGRIRIPEDMKEYLAIYTTEYDDSYILEPIMAGDLQAYRESIKDRKERMVEASIDYDVIDPGASFSETKRLMRIRKLNRKIGENLKILYGYRCQICGRIIGEEFGSHIAEAHHIDYYVTSLNNDSNNQMVLCPNHHSIIHDADPRFDRKRMLYLYPNGLEQKIVMNLHLY
jgi:hypothetical protein